MKQVWQTEDGEVFSTEEDAKQHEVWRETNDLISNWVKSRTWTDETQAMWLIQVLQNDYSELRDFLGELPWERS